MSLAPIALFVYNRPDHTRRTIKFLKENLLADESRLYVFSDGSKSSEQESAVNEVRQVIDQIEGFKSLTIVRRQSNMGLANSIIDGVGMLNEKYGKVIVFEDDLLSSPYTLKFFNDALNKYQNSETVMHIGAYMFPISPVGLPDSFFHPVVTSWGWATWDRAWKHFDPDIDVLISKFDASARNRFSIEGTMNFWKQMRDFKKGKNNSWAIRWYASVFLKGGLALHPTSSLVHNIGHDGSGTHSGINDIYSVKINTSEIKSFPSTIIENQEAHIRIREFLRKRKGSFWDRLKRAFKSIK